jgi:hypothetical protein
METSEYRENLENIQEKLELLTRKWWFYLLFVLLQFVPPYASKGFKSAETGMVTSEILSRSLAYSYPSAFPIFKIIPMIFVISLVFLKNAVRRPFSVYVGIAYVLFAFLQNIAVTEKYGLGIITINLVMFCLVAAFWFWEAIIQKNDFTPRKQPVWKYWVIPAAFLAFWYPGSISGASIIPDFNPAYILTNVAGLTFCMMTPVYIAILTLYYPRINMVTIRVTSLVGVIIGIYNVLTNFILYISLLWWNGVLHIPLLMISLYALILSFKKIPRA